MKDLTLWVFDLDVLKLRREKYCSLVKDSNRSNRIFLKHGKKFMEDNAHDPNAVEIMRQTLGMYVSTHQLQDYADKICLNYEGYENYIQNLEELIELTRQEDKLISKINSERLALAYTDIVKDSNEAFIHHLCGLPPIENDNKDFFKINGFIHE